MEGREGAGVEEGRRGASPAPASQGSSLFHAPPGLLGYGCGEVLEAQFIDAVSLLQCCFRKAC